MDTTNNKLYELEKKSSKFPSNQLNELLNQIDSLVKIYDIVNVAIDGNSGAGKSTLATILTSVYDCNIFHMDDFFLRPELRTPERLKEIGGNVDYVRFKEEVIEELMKNKYFEYQIFNCQKMKLDGFIKVSPKKLNIIEGSYSMHPTLVESYQLKIFLEIEAEAQKERILERNGPIMLNRFVNEWIPLENIYFKELKIKEQSDIKIRMP